MVQWWDSGPGAEERAKKREEEALQRQRQSVSRVWQRPGNKCVLTFISSEIVHFAEHQYQQPSGGWSRYVCLEGSRTADDREIPCPFCLSKIRQEFSMYAGTVINHTGFHTRDGDAVKHIKQALVLKGTAKSAFLKQLGMMKKAHGNSFDHCWTVWEIEREDKPKSSTPGIFYEFKGNRSRETLLKKMKEVGVERDDWDRYLEPYAVERLAIYLEPEAAYRMLRIPYNYGSDTVAAVSGDNYDEDFDDLEFPTSAAGSEQSVDNFANPPVKGASAVETLANDDDDDAKAIEDFELLK